MVEVSIQHKIEVEIQVEMVPPLHLALHKHMVDQAVRVVTLFMVFLVHREWMEQEDKIYRMVCLYMA